MNQQDKERLRELAEKADAENTSAAWTRLDNYVTPRLILALLEENERLTAWIKSTKWPANAQEVRAFFRHNCESEQWAIDEHTASEDDRYQLTAHDFLSAADWWTDFMNRDVDAAMAKQGEK